MPFCWVVEQMQNNGILIDQSLMADFREECSVKLVAIRKEWADALGYPLNPNSPVQVLETFRDDFKIELEETDELHLLKAVIQQPRLLPLVRSILDYRDLLKKRSTYLNLVPDRDGRVRSTFKAYGTVTWRLSSSDPNLQNVPREVTQGINVKDIYKAPEGYVFLELDHRQLEFRIPAYASGCHSLIDRFEKGEDVYLYYASIIFERPITTKGSERQFAKTYKLAEGYGAGAKKIQETMLLETGKYGDPIFVDIPKIRRIQDQFKLETPEKFRWHEAGKHLAERTGLLYDGFTTPRYLHGRREDYRSIGYSWPTAATASGIVNRNMLRIYEAYGHNLCSDEIKLVLQVHDALYFEVRERDWRIHALTIKSLMEEPHVIFGKTVSFPVDIKVGERWGHMKEVTM